MCTPCMALKLHVHGLHVMLSPYYRELFCLQEPRQRLPRLVLIFPLP